MFIADFIGLHKIVLDDIKNENDSLDDYIQLLNPPT